MDSFKHTALAIKSNPTAEYNIGFRIAFLSCILSTAFLLRQGLYEYQLYGPIEFLPLLAFAVCSFLFFYIGHKKGCWLLQSCPADAYWFMAIAIVGLSTIITIIWYHPISLNGIYEEQLRLSASWSSVTNEFSELGDKQDFSFKDLLFRGPVILGDFILNCVWSLIKVLFGLCLRILALVYIVLIVILTFLIGVASYVLKIRRGILLLLLCPFAVVSLWSYNVATPGTETFAPALALFLLSILLVTNWRGTRLNRDVSSFHPRYYSLLTNVSSYEEDRITASSIREEIDRTLSDVSQDLKPELSCALENRLMEENLIVPNSDGSYRRGYLSRLGIGHLFLGAFTILYLLNAGMGVAELIPDNIPFIGNLDEAVIAAWVFTYLRKLYLADKAERSGSIAVEPSGSAHPQPDTLSPKTLASATAQRDLSTLADTPDAPALVHEPSDSTSGGSDVEVKEKRDT